MGGLKPASPDAAVMTVEVSPPALPRQEPVGGRTRVLVVDDEDDQRDLLCAWFRRAGCEVHHASGAVQALELAAGFAFDLFVLDLRMPGVSGWVLAQTLRHIQGDGRVAICSVLDPQDYPMADDVLPKPVTRAAVAALLARQVTGRRVR